MVVKPPFLYDPVKTGDFDPRAATRASFQTTRSNKPRPVSQGPLVSFNQHPDSFVILPYGNTNAIPMDPSVKKWVKWMRILQLVLRCIEMLCAGGQLAMMIVLTTPNAYTLWIMRIAPGVALLHTVYGIYHLARKASGRTPASSASYMLFASFFDVGLVSFYAFSSMMSRVTPNIWTTAFISNTSLYYTFSTIVFYVATVAAALHLVSLAISLYLAVTFRKIVQLPPDMNPLEDNLTSRHKRNKSSMSTATTITEKRLSTPLEDKRRSGAAYEDLARPPTIPFFHTRTQSTDSFSTYQNSPPPSRDNRQTLPSRQYQIRPDSSRSSMTATEPLKRASYYGQHSTPPKRTSYTEVPLSDSASQRPARPHTWYTSDSMTNIANSKGRTTPRKGTQYQPLHQRYDSDDTGYDHPNPLEVNPPTPRFAPTGRDLALAQTLGTGSSKNHSGDIADMSADRELTPQRDESPGRESLKAKHYGELKPGTPPVMVGKDSRQVSSGNDYVVGKSSFKVLNPREVSGKIAEEGRGGDMGNGWGTRFRKISGKLVGKT